MSAPALRLDGVTFAFRADRPILDAVHLHLTPGWTGLVGPNGAGKSTLMRILAGELAAGAVRREPADLSVLRVEQRLDEPGPDTAAFAEAWDGEAVRLQSRLSLGMDDLARWSTLSPGERRRWQIGAALWRRPDVLLLDEPDNHLDRRARQLLVNALRGFAGIGVVVSHDRELLDALTGRTVRVRNGHLDAVDGPYSHASSVWADAEQALLDELDAAQREQRRMRRQLRAAADTHASASRSRSLRHTSHRDPDARSMARKFRAAHAEQSHSQALRRAQTATERAGDRLAELERPEEVGRAIHVDYEAPRKRVLVELVAPVVRAGEHPVLRDVDVRVERGDHIALEGPNGAGKSTLVRAILDRCTLPAERVLHLPQELSPAETAAVLERLHALPSEARGRVLQWVAALGVPPGQVLATACPSPGEARKVALALGLGTHAWLIVLDEPDNHLDLPARQRLEAALVGFPGAVVLVTHDRHLADAVCDRRWGVQDGTVRVS